MRKVLVFSTLSNSTTEVSTSATTWGELSQFLTSKGLFNPSGMKAIVKETKATLELNEAVLPDGDFVLYTIPTKNKSGAEVINTDDVDTFLTILLDDIEAKFENFIASKSYEVKNELEDEAYKILQELGL